MSTLVNVPHHPSDELCVGRDALCERLAKSSLKYGLTLFFGGPKSGKRTALLSLARTWSSRRLNNASSLQKLAVLLDLRTTPGFANDRAFYQFALEAIWNETRDRLPDLELPPIALELRAATSCHWFFENLRTLIRAAPALDFQIILIVHHADYLLGQSFSEVLERNMVSFFRNSESRDGRGIGSQSRIGLILSGGAKLYAQSHNPDLHSPLRGVHEREYCMNLTSTAVGELVEGLAGTSDNQICQLKKAIFASTGGQAALARKLAEALVPLGDMKGRAISVVHDKAASELRETAALLLHSAREDLLRCGPYSNAALEALRREPRLTERQLREELRRRGLVETLYQQAGESVAMCGFAQWDRDQAKLTRCNKFFWPELSSKRSGSLGAPATGEQSKFVFARNQKFANQWDVVFQGREIKGVTHKFAFIQIAALLEFRGRSFTAMELDNLVNQPPDALSEHVQKQAGEVLDERRRFAEANSPQRLLSEKDRTREDLMRYLRAIKVPQLERAAEECRARLMEADSNASSDDAALDDDAYKTLQLRLLCISEVLEERSPNATATAAAKRDAYKRVREGIDRAIRFFEAKEPDFGIHLRASLWPDLSNGETRKTYCYKGECVWKVA